MRCAIEKIETVEAGSGDVFADLGFQDAGERKLRVQLAMRINELLRDRKLTQAKASALFGIPQPHISDLKHYKLNRFSPERLIHFITMLDKDVEIIIRPKAKGHETGLLSVLAAA
ncbi:MAG: helix-turn-helix domain-containing protein [Gallionella sp.]|nr:helix-turn-helix domain-containing protein [Gallionella sp.]